MTARAMAPRSSPRPTALVDLVNDKLELWPLLNQLSLGSVPWLAIERALHRRLAEYHGYRTPPCGIDTERLTAATGRRRA